MIDNERMKEIIDAAAGRIKSDTVFKNALFMNVFTNELCLGDIAVKDGIIVGIGYDYMGESEIDMSGKIMLPGFIDAHIHLESSLVTPEEFAKAVLPHGTTTVVSDPHEITNVMGSDGIEYMLQATEGLPLDVRIMLPSCVPATPDDENGASFDAEDIEKYYGRDRVTGLAEMMNYVGTYNADKDIINRISGARSRRLPVDGHAPGLNGKELCAYLAAGVRSDHECTEALEAFEKLELGQHIMIREGTAARDLDALLPLMTPKYYERVMLCTDDRHPDDLLAKGDIDHILKRAIFAGVDPVVAVKCATYNPARYFGFDDKGAIAPGYAADITVIDNLESFNVIEVYKDGERVFDGQNVREFPKPSIDPKLAGKARGSFRVKTLLADDFTAKKAEAVIGIVPGQIITTDEGTADGTDIEKDIIRAAVVERHKGTGHIGTGYLKGYGLRSGAVATSISHDSHNIIVVGTNECDMAAAANRVAELGGGMVVSDGGQIAAELPLPVAGLMSDEPLDKVNAMLTAVSSAAHERGVPEYIDPFMTLSFMALTVIPTLRLSTAGVFDVLNQKTVGNKN